jgi:hypothetical protein
LIHILSNLKYQYPTREELGSVAAVGRLRRKKANQPTTNHIDYLRQKNKTWPAAPRRTLQRCPGLYIQNFVTVLAHFAKQSDVRPVRRTLTLLVGEKLSHQRTVRNFNCSYTLIINTIHRHLQDQTCTAPYAVNSVEIQDRNNTARLSESYSS